MTLTEIYERVKERDKELCQCCFAQAKEIHHIVHRSHFGKKGKAIRDSDRNLICLCLKCHAHAHRHGLVGTLLRLLRDRFKYDYSDWPFMRWINDK